MADLPPNIGFDDEPVILLNYVTLEDTIATAKPLIMSKGRNRVRSDSSIVSSSGAAASKRRGNKSSVSSLSDASSLDPSDTDKLTTPFHSQESDPSPLHSSSSKASPLKRLDEEEKNCLKSLEEVDSSSSIASNEGRKLGDTPSPTERDGLKEKRKKSFTVNVEPKIGPSYQRQLSSPSHELSSLLLERDKEIASLRRQLQEIQATTSQPRVSFENSISQAPMPHSSGYGSETLETPPPSSSLTESGHTPQRSTLQRLLEEQQVSYRLKTDNSELRSKVLILESEVDNLRQQNLVQLQQLEQATTSLAAASVNSTHSATPSPQKTKKKSSFFGLRRSGRKSSMGAKNGSGSSIEQSPRLKRPGFHSSSNLSLEGSLSEHDISSLLARKPEARVGSEFHGNSIDFERLQMTLKLSMEEKSELGRQLELLREELKHQEDKREELLKERISKDDFMEMSVKLEETLQALQLATREKELLESEGEGLKYELETLRSERDNLTALLKGKEVKAVLKEKQEMDFLRSENKALMSEVRTLISNSDNLETSLSQLKREMVARDVRGHELKLKIKKLEKENGELKTLAAAAIKEDTAKSKREEKKGEGNSKKKTQRVTQEDPISPIVNHSPSEKPIFTISPSFYSPDQQSPSTGQPAMKLYSTKPSPFLTASTGETHHVSTHVSAHERTQSEDLTSVGMAPPLQMIRTSSGGTKFVAVQVTLPTKENATKVLDKSFSVPSLEEAESTRNFSKRKNSDSTLGTFVGAMSAGSNANGNKPGVNSLVKMFELGKGSKSGEDGSNKENVVGGRGSGVLSGSLIESSLEESIEEEKLMTEQKTQSYHTRSASSSSSSSTKGLRSRKHSSTSSLKEEQERKKAEEEEAKQLKKKEEERKRLELEAKRKEEAKERQRKEHEAKERQKKEERLRKEQEKQRKEQEAREKREKFKREQEAKERERKEQEAKERVRREQEAKERERKEQEAKEKEKREQEAKEKEKREQEAKKREQEAKERERKEKEAKEKERREQEARKRQEREAKEREEKKLKDEERRKRDELTADRSQTWPPKAENITTPSTNTLPGTSTHHPETTPAAQPNPQPINKPKPPPGVGTRSKTQANLFSSTQGDSSLTGVVANLRSSWEKKSQMGMVPQAPSHPRLSKAPSVPISYPRMERTSSLNVPAPPSSQVAAPPFVKTGSGPAGTVISSPSDSKTTNMSIKRVGYVSDSNATPTNPTHTQQNGHVNLRNKATVVRTTSGDGSGSGEVVLRGHTSPRLARPASLYVTSTSSGPPPSVNFGTPTSEKRLSSLITKLQVKESSNTVPTTSPSSSSFVQNQSPVLSRSTGGMAITSNNKNAVPPLTRPHSFYAGSSPKPLTRAASLASPLDRRTKKNMLLRWCQIMTQDYHNIMISNFGESFSDGLAFCALLHHFVPDKIPYETLDGVNQKRNFEIAFSVAEGLGIPSLLDVDDMVEMAIPDWMSVMTYVSYIYNHFSKKESQYS